MLVETDMFEGKIDKVKEAIAELKRFEPKEGYYLAFSGGKDSIVIKKLAQLSGVKFDSHYNNTTIDPPELRYYIRKYHKDVEIINPDKPLLKMLETRGYPQRQSRWCCAEYKEKGGGGRIVITGVRAEESVKRARRKRIEFCYKDDTKRFMNIIIGWTEKEVWEFIKLYKLPYCELYDRGFKRIGCLMCPIASKSMRLKEAVEYPRYTLLFQKAFEKLYQNRKRVGAKSVDYWKNGKEMFIHWLNNQSKDNPDQTIMFE